MMLDAGLDLENGPPLLNVARSSRETEGETKTPSGHEKGSAQSIDSLSSSRIILPDLAPGLEAGCRGIIGPVPPPLWIRVNVLSCARWSARRENTTKVSNAQ